MPNQKYNFVSPIKILSSFLFMLAFTACGGGSGPTEPPVNTDPTTNSSMSPGMGSFIWDDKTGASAWDKPLKVYYFRPTELTTETPVWIIMHGLGRNADDYRDYFIAMARDQGAIVIAPEFTDQDWPESRSYNLGNISVSESDRTPQPEQEWSFSKIEPLFDYLVDVLEPTLETKNYFMFGHSAGAQFVHRFLAWKPQARVKLAISANAGWYTMAQYNNESYSHDWPYSLANTPDFNTGTSAIDPFPDASLETYLGKTMVVLLGDEDTNRTSNLRQTPQADAQGQHRFERGNFFFAEAQAEANVRGVNFGWEKQIVPGVGHSGSEMAIPAAEIFRLADSIVQLSGIYQVSDGTNHSVIHDLNMKEFGYIDITNYGSSVSLLDESLIPIFEDLESSNLVESGNYKIKFTNTSTSLIPGTVSIFGLKFQLYESLDNIVSGQYNANGSLGTYSVYYRFDHPSGGNIDVTTFKASVCLYNYSLFGNDGQPMVDHYEDVSGNSFLDAGSYIVKFTFIATSLMPGSVTFLIGG